MIIAKNRISPPGGLFHKTALTPGGLIERGGGGGGGGLFETGGLFDHLRYIYFFFYKLQ